MNPECLLIKEQAVGKAVVLDNYSTKPWGWNEKGYICCLSQVCVGLIEGDSSSWISSLWEAEFATIFRKAK